MGARRLKCMSVLVTSLAAAAALSGCAGDTKIVVVAPSTVPLAAETVETTPIPETTTIQTRCALERSLNFDIAIEVYVADKGELPASFEDLVAGGYLKDNGGGFVSHWAIRPDGSVVGIGDCEGS
jgi:hypothetical protein